MVALSTERKFNELSKEYGHKGQKLADAEFRSQLLPSGSPTVPHAALG